MADSVIEAWYMDNDTEVDQREPHQLSPNEPVSLEQLEQLGVLHWVLSGNEDDEELERIRQERGYSYMDQVDLRPDRLPNYEEKIRGFFQEHLHTDEEVRYILDGEGYFDVRDKDNRWIRILLRAGALITLPSGLWHRFTMTTSNYTKALRLFKGEPVWTPYPRESTPEEHPARQDYVSQFIRPKRARVNCEPSDRITAGATMPEVTLTYIPVDCAPGAADVQAVSTTEFFSGKKVLLCGAPGAFTPTCTDSHLASVIANASAFRERGVDVVAMVCVNDVFVMHAWGVASNVAGSIDYMLADGNGDLVAALGLSADMTAHGMGFRLQRFALLVDNGTVVDVRVGNDVFAEQALEMLADTMQTEA